MTETTLPSRQRRSTSRELRRGMSGTAVHCLHQRRQRPCAGPTSQDEAGWKVDDAEGPGDGRQRKAPGRKWSRYRFGHLITHSTPCHSSILLDLLPPLCGHHRLFLAPLNLPLRHARVPVTLAGFARHLAGNPHARLASAVRCAQLLTARLPTSRAVEPSRTNNCSPRSSVSSVSSCEEQLRSSARPSTDPRRSKEGSRGAEVRSEKHSALCLTDSGHRGHAAAPRDMRPVCTHATSTSFVAIHGSGASARPNHLARACTDDLWCI